MSNPFADRVRGELLHEWRVAQQMEVTALASRSNLSVAQILQLEGGGNSLFYTPAIKESAARKLARLLGGDPAVVVQPLDDSQAQHEPQVIQDLTHLLGQRSVPLRQTSVFYRQPGLIAAPILILIAVVSGSGWLQQKWQNGGSQQFWRETPGVFATLAREPSSGASALATPDLVLPTAAPAAPLAQASESDKQVTTLSQAATAAQVAEPVQSRHVALGLCGKVEADTVLVPTRPSKSGNMVYIVAQKDGAVCVVDASGASTVLALKTHETRSVYGPPPWRVHFEQPQQAQLYFQGVRLRLPETQVTTLALQEGSTSY
ncbi:helix-turn-helix transcriptional regulator [Limnohabitans sp. Rim47]|uniref:helix-turn-helix domain-containing protein n=1 Tax=Limnohabitans sp. Rim47 TaxID=1100721 RepID=UPI000A9F9AD7|nr:helix-turn-helix transcriptional regulator [Limnohabitans sp. Rim47]